MTSAPTLPRLGAVVVNYDGGASLLGCVASLRQAGASEIAVVDNGSRDGSLAALADADRAVHLLPQGLNLGYGSGANRGITRLGEIDPDLQLFVVCNPDVEVDPGSLTRLVEVLERRPETAVVGPALYWPSGERYPSARSFPSYLTALAHGLIGMFVPDNPWSRRYRGEQRGDLSGGGEADRSGEPPVDWVSGACFVVRRCAFESVGGFDEGYFMYVEDLDLCWRLRKAGWEIRYVPSARAVHDQGLSAKRRPYRMLAAHHRSTWRFARRRAVGPERLALPAIGAAIGFRLAVAAAREALSGNRRGGPLG